MQETLFYLLVILLSVITGSESVCNSPRVRRSWAAMTSSERELFIKAIQSAYSSGRHRTFSDIHRENFDDSHGTSLFLV
jgi:hypothetical protein